MEPGGTSGTAGDDSSAGAWRRWGPIAVVTAVVIGVVAVGLASGGGDGGDTTPTTAAVARPEGVVTWSMAEEEGLDVTFPDTCDADSGMVAIPFIFRTECFADVDDN